MPLTVVPSPVPKARSPRRLRLAGRQRSRLTPLKADARPRGQIYLVPREVRPEVVAARLDNLVDIAEFRQRLAPPVAAVPGRGRVRRVRVLGVSAGLSALVWLGIAALHRF